MTKYNLHLIKGRHSYTPAEIAHLFGISRKTPLRWLQEGLPPIQKNTKPLLIWGEELRLFLSKKAKKWKVTLKENEFYCVKCKKPREAKAGTVSEVATGKRIGNPPREQFRREGKCVKCGTDLRRFIRVSEKD